MARLRPPFAASPAPLEVMSGQDQALFNCNSRVTINASFPRIAFVPFVYSPTGRRPVPVTFFLPEGEGGTICDTAILRSWLCWELA